MAKRHTYTVTGGGVDHTGWYKVHLRRDDGKEVSVSKRRVSDLRRDGRLIETDQDQPPQVQQ